MAHSLPGRPGGIRHFPVAAQHESYLIGTVTGNGLERVSASKCYRRSDK
jgi:hypothetical protein